MPDPSPSAQGPAPDPEEGCTPGAAHGAAVRTTDDHGADDREAVDRRADGRKAEPGNTAEKGSSAQQGNPADRNAAHPHAAARKPEKPAGASAARARVAHLRARTTTALTPLARFLTRFAPAVAVAVAALLYGTLSVLMWANYYSPSWDLGIFTQLMDRYSKLQAPIVDIKGPGYNLLGDHFHPLLVVLAPIFAIFPSGLTLLLCQSALFAASAWPLTSLAFERLSAKGAWLLAFAYVFSFGLLNAVTAQFHEIALAVPLMAFGLVWWIRGRRLSAAVALSLLVFCKEDLGLTVAMFGAVVWLKDRRDLKWALGFAAWGVMWFLYAVFVFIPMFNTEGGYDYTDNVTLAQTVLEGLTTKIGTVGCLALAAGAIGLRSPYILLMLPTLAWRFAGNVEGYWNLSFHYSAVLMPIAVVALLDAAKRRHRSMAPLVAALASVALISQTSLHLLWDIDRYKVDGGPAVQAASRYGSVGTDLHLLAYLAPKTHVYWTSTLGGVRPDAIALRPDDTHESVEAWAEQNLGGDWKLVYSGEGYEVVAQAS